MSKLNIVFWTMTGNTQIMADCIADGAKAAGAEVKVCNVSETTPAEALDADMLALGCPAMGAEMLDEGEFEPFFAELLPGLNGRTVALFGSYGWGDGEWMRTWQQRVTEAGGTVFQGEGLIVNERPDDAAMTRCEELGTALAQA